MSEERTIKNAELALAAKRRTVGSSQLDGEALDLFLNKKPFELEEIISGASVGTLPEKQIFDPNVKQA